MAKGPVPSTTKDIAGFKTSYDSLNDEDIKYNEQYFKFYQTNGDSYISAIAETDTNKLSKTDIEAMDFALNHFGIILGIDEKNRMAVVAANATPK